MDPKEKHEMDNYSNQNNPTSDVYWQARGHDERPDDWEDIVDQNNDED